MHVLRSEAATILTLELREYVYIFIYPVQAATSTGLEISDL